MNYQIYGYFGACTDSVYQALFPFPLKVQIYVDLHPSEQKEWASGVP